MLDAGAPAKAKVRLGGIAADLLGGSSSAFVTLTTILSCGVVAYQSLGPALTGAGISAAFITCIILGLTGFILSGPPLHISSPKTPLAAMLSAFIASSLATPEFAAGLPADPAARASQLIDLATITVILCGAIQLLLAAGGLSRLVRYLPYPVVAGFLNGFAIQVVLSQLPHALGLHQLGDLMTGLTAINPWSAGLALMAVLVTLLLQRVSPKVPAGIIALLAGTVIYHALARVIPPERLGPVAGSMPAQLPVGFGLPGLHKLLASPGLTAVMGPLLITALTLAIINTVQGAMNLTAGDVLSGGRHDSHKELVAQGVANLLSGLAGGLSGSGSLLNTALAHANGARTRMANLGFAVVLAAMGLLLGPAVSLLPYPVIAGVVIALSLGLMDLWTREMVQRAISRSNHLWHATMAVDLVLVGLVTLLVVFASLAVALGVGVSVSTLVFLRRASDGAVRRQMRADVMRSRTGRTRDATTILDRHGDRIVLIELQGPLFFGTIPPVEQAIDRAGTGAETVILDLRRVHLIDSTGAISLRRLSRDLRRNGAQLLLASLPRHGAGWHRLEVAGFALDELEKCCFPDTDHALAHAEDQLLAALNIATDPDQELQLADFDACRGLSPSDLTALGLLMHRIAAPAGHEILREGDPGDSMFLLARGKVAITTQNYQMRLAGYHAGVAFGEAALMTGQPRSATVRAETDTVLYEITKSNFSRFAQLSPSGALAIVTNLARLQSERIRGLNAAVRALSG